MTEPGKRREAPNKRPHGPYSECGKSPTGDHCWHTRPNGVKICCWCGRLKDW